MQTARLCSASEVTAAVMRSSASKTEVTFPSPSFKVDRVAWVEGPARRTGIDLALKALTVGDEP